MAVVEPASRSSSHIPVLKKRGRGRTPKCSQVSAECGDDVQGEKKKQKQRVRFSEDDVYVSKEARQFMQERAEELRVRLDSKFPSFMKMMLPSHVSGCFWLGLPTAFCRDHMPEEDTQMDLVDEDSGSFKSMYLPRKTGLSGGWRGFSLAKGLVHGDALVFQLVDSITFKVYILRANDFAAAGAAVQLLHQGADEASSESWEEVPLGQLKKVRKGFPTEGEPSRSAPEVPDVEQDQLCDTSEDSAGVMPMSDDSSSLRPEESQVKQRQQLKLQLPQEGVVAAAQTTPAPRVSTNKASPSGSPQCKEGAGRNDGKKQEPNATKRPRMVRIGQSDYVVDVEEEQGNNFPASQLNSASRPRCGPTSGETRRPPQAVRRQGNSARPLPAVNTSFGVAAQSPNCRWQDSGENLVLYLQLGNNTIEENCSIAASTGCSSCAHFKHAVAHSDEVLQAAAEENARLTFRVTCKACLNCEASMLLLPCRHLCLCGSCQPELHFCPVCNAAKVSCVRVFLS